MSKRIPMKEWGRDHTSTLLYLETCIVDHQGKLNPAHMRTDYQLHPGVPMTRAASIAGRETKYPTRLGDGSGFPHPHDDWSCLEDAEEAGLCANVGTGLNPLYRLTDTGWDLLGRLRLHRAGADGTAFPWGEM